MNHVVKRQLIYQGHSISTGIPASDDTGMELGYVVRLFYSWFKTLRSYMTYSLVKASLHALTGVINSYEEVAILISLAFSPIRYFLFVCYRFLLRITIKLRYSCRSGGG